MFLSLAVTSRAAAEEKFRGLLESAPDAMVVADSAGRMVLVNAQTEKLFGYSRRELIGNPVEMVIPTRLREGHISQCSRYSAEPQARPMGRDLELFGLRKDGLEIPVEVSLAPMHGEEGILISSAIRDITSRKKLEQALRELSLTDPLTGLGNYRRLEIAFETESRRFERTAWPFTLLLLDLDGLKKINDTYGHMAGSKALCLLADALRAECRSIDTAARFGGDEFAVIMPDTGAEGAELLADRLANRLAQKGQSPTISFSYGMGTYSRNETLDQLIAVSDHILYAMKKSKAQTP